MCVFFFKKVKIIQVYEMKLPSINDAIVEMKQEDACMIFYSTSRSIKKFKFLEGKTALEQLNLLHRLCSVKNTNDSWQDRH